MNRSIQAKPPETVLGGVKITEQGEVLSSRYALKPIASRSLEQATSALLLSAATAITGDGNEPEAAWVQAMDEISGHALEAYQGLVFGDPAFLSFFLCSSAGSATSYWPGWNRRPPHRRAPACRRSGREPP